MTKVYSFKINFHTVAARYIRRKLLDLDKVRFAVEDVTSGI